MNIDFADELNDREDSSTLRLSCFAHTLQLCVRDGLKNAPYVSKSLDKCQALAKFSHKSSKMADVMEDMNKHINRMNVTRWNSELLLLKSIASIGKNDLNLINSLSDNPTRFSNKDFTILQEIIDVLDPFHEITVRCQAETAVTASLVVPSVVHLMVHLRDILGNVNFCSKLVQQLELSLKKRFSGVINRLNLVDVDPNEGYGDPLYFVATVLDPAFKFYWMHDLKISVTTENRLKQNIIQIIIDEINKNETSPTNSSPRSNSSTSSSSTSTPVVKRRKLFVYDENAFDSSQELKSMDPAIEVEAYLNDPVRTKFSDYWSHSQLQSLKHLVQRIFTVQASSAPIERVFSQAGLISSPRRMRMSESAFRDLVFLRVNQNLLP